MTLSRAASRAGIALLLAIVASAKAQTLYEPQVGQAGKDVIWVPTPQSLVDKMLDMAAVTPEDYVVDLGSGDGRTVITAAKRGARAHGIEYNADMVELSRRNAASAGLAGKATFAQADLFESDFSDASVVTMFLLPSINLKLRPKLLQLRPGTRLVSNSFTMDAWKPDETATVAGGCGAWCVAYLWIVPARVEGTWQLPQGELALRQEFQLLSGTLRKGDSTQPIEGGRLRGSDITFSADGVEYRGSAEDGRMELLGNDGSRWTATRLIR